MALTALMRSSSVGLTIVNVTGSGFSNVGRRRRMMFSVEEEPAEMEMLV